MFLSSVVVQALIIVGVVILFLLSVILNRRVQPPKGVKLPEKCNTCPSSTCLIKMSDVEKMKEELKEYLNDCEEEKDEHHEEK